MDFFAVDVDKARERKVKEKVRRCVDIYETSLRPTAKYDFGRVGRGRGHAEGWKTDHVPAKVRKRLRGAGRKAMSLELEFELYQWLVDTVGNLCSRVTRPMLAAQAKVLRATSKALHSEWAHFTSAAERRAVTSSFAHIEFIIREAMDDAHQLQQLGELFAPSEPAHS